MGSAIKHSLGNTKNWIRYYWKHLLILSVVVVALFGFAVVAERTEETFFDRMIDNIFNTKRMDDIANKLGVYADDNFNTVQVYGYEVKNMGSLIGSIYSMCVCIGICFLCITFFTGLMSMRAQDITEEMFFRKFILFVVGVLLCANAEDIVIATVNLGSGVAEAAAADYTAKDGDAAESVRKLKDAIYYSTHTAKYTWSEVPEDVQPWVDKTIFSDKIPDEWYKHISDYANDWSLSLGYTLDFLLPWLMAWFTNLILSFVVASRGIEIILMCAFSPLMFMDSSSLEDFSHSSAFRYVKTVLAISLQGAVIVGIIMIGAGMMSSVIVDMAKNEGIGNAGTVAGNMVLIMLTEAGMCLKSGQIARSIVQAG